MKVAFFSESKADETVLKHFVEEISLEELEEKDIRKNLQFRSSSHLVKNLPVVIRSVHYGSDAEFLVISSDSDDTPVHLVQHETTENEECHLCLLGNIVRKSLAELQEFEGKQKLQIAIGVPVPAIEAWLLFGLNPQVSENTWIRKQNGEKITYDRKKLKTELYGGEHVPEAQRIEISIKAIQRIIENQLLEGLEKEFPQGFGKMADKVRNWK